CTGTPSDPITLRAETPGKVVLSGASQLRFGGSWLIARDLHFRKGHHPDGAVVFRADSKRLAHHCRLTESAIVEYNPSLPKDESKWVSIYGTQNRVDHCY